MEDAGDGVRSVERAAQIIQVVADAGSDGARLTDIVTRTGLYKTTAHRILQTLLGLGWLEQDHSGANFFLGLPLASIGATAADRHGLLDLANPHLSRLAELTGDTVYLSVRMGSHALCLDRVLGSFPIRTLTLRIGDRRPLGVGAGSLALLAWLDDEEVERITRANAGNENDSRLDPAQLQGLVATSRAQGYAHNPGLIVPGAEAVGVPVFCGDERIPVAALSIAAIESRIAEPRRAQLVGWLQREASALADEITVIAPQFRPADARRLLPDLEN